jgi:hypothetical protein
MAAHALELKLWGDHSPQTVNVFPTRLPIWPQIFPLSFALSSHLDYWLSKFEMECRLPLSASTPIVNGQALHVNSVLSVADCGRFAPMKKTSRIARPAAVHIYIHCIKRYCPRYGNTNYESLGSKLNPRMPEMLGKPVFDRKTDSAISGVGIANLATNKIPVSLTTNQACYRR